MLCAKFVVGLTGGIGSGKSTVAELFAKKGVSIIDTDLISRQLTQPDQPALTAIVKKFGDEVLTEDKHLNRKLLRKMIFTHPEHRRWLEKLLHPLIRTEMKRLVKLSGSVYCIAVIPLLFEGEPNELINRTLVVDAPEELQISRTAARDQHTSDEVKAIITSQILRSKRLAAADDVIVNDGKIEDLEKEVTKLHNFYLSLCKP